MSQVEVKAASSFKNAVRYVAGAAAGGAAGLWSVSLLPLMALRIGGSGDFSAEFWLLPFAGAALGYLLQRLIGWAAERPYGDYWLAASLPWSSVFFIAAALLLPSARFGMTGSPLGPIKHFLSAAWILGCFWYGFFLIRAISSRFDPLRIAASFAAIVFLISFSLAIQPPAESDEGDYLFAALAIARTGTTRVDKVYETNEFFDFYYNMIPGSARLYQHIWGHYHFPLYRYSLRMPGYPLLLSPFVAVARLVEVPTVRWWIVYLPGMFAYGMLMYAIASWIQSYGRNNRVAVVAFGTMTPYIYFATNTQPENFLAAGSAFGLLYVMKACDAAKDSSRTIARAALISVGALLIHERMAAISAVFLIYAWFNGGSRRSLLGWSAAAMVPVIFSYAAILQFEMPAKAPHAYGTDEFVNLTRWWSAAWQHLFSPEIGIFLRLPVLVVTLFAFFNRGHKGLSLSLCAFSAYFVLIFTYPHSFDSWPHLRYMVPAIPLLLPSLCAGLEVISKWKYHDEFIRFLIGVQLAIAWPFLSVPPIWKSFSSHFN